MICWYCYWGWPREVMAIYREHLAASSFIAMHFGPAHVVWEDENFNDACVKACLEHAKKGEYCNNLTIHEIGVVAKSLEKLLEVPESIRCCEPEDYDEMHPENYPPPAGITMEQK